MYYPHNLGPFFTGYMTLADPHRYPTQHFKIHRKRLTLPDTNSGLAHRMIR